jgi:ABC-type dipeptide/oligopeptide/nickel transport system permease component
VPWTVLGLPLAGLVLRVTRGATIAVLDEDDVRTARTKGLRPARVVLALDPRLRR